MRILIITFIIPLFLNPINAQSKIQEACSKLTAKAFHTEFNKNEIDNAKQELIISINESSIKDYRECNCIDLIWLQLRNPNRKIYSEFSFTSVIDTNQYLEILLTDVDRINLSKELKIGNLNSIEDSLSYVLDRARSKLSSKKDREKFYWQSYAESNFFGWHSKKLTKSYFKIFDDQNEFEKIRELMLDGIKYSNNSVEEEIIIRIGNPKSNKFFNLMLDILKLYGADKSVLFLIQELKIKKLDVKERVAIFVTIYEINKRVQLNNETIKNFESYIDNNKLDGLNKEAFLKRI